MIHKATKAVDEDLEYHLASFDFAKAFDKVSHNMLIYKLKKYHFSQQVVQWVEEWLKGRTSIVTVNGMVSEGFAVTSGVPQGSVLGPLLFLIYINDLPAKITSAECRSYADDTLLCMNLKDGGQTALQGHVTALEEWSLKWGMKFNPRKCAHVRVGKTGEPGFDLTLNSTVIPEPLSVK